MITLSAGIKYFTVNFTPSNELDVELYTVHACHEDDLVGGNFTPTASNRINIGRESSYTHTVDRGGNWYVKVAAIDSWENVAAIDYAGLNYSALQSVAVPTLDPLDTVAPNVPSGLSLTSTVDISGQADTSNITATWNANSEDDFGGYLLQLRKGSETNYTEVQIAKGTSSHVFSSLIPSSSYSCRIAAYDKWANVSEFSSWVTISTAASSAVPSAPSSLTISSGIKTVSIQIAGTRGTNWKEYVIELATTGAFTTPAYSLTTVNSINSIQVAAGTYYVRAKAVSRSNISSSWATSSPASVVINPTATEIVNELTNKITESELYASLNERIDLIDAPSTGLVQQLVTVNNNMSAMQTQLNSLTVGPFDSAASYSVGDLVTYSGNTYKCILATTAPSPVPSNATYWELSNNSSSLSAMISEEQELRISRDAVLANTILGVTSTLDGNETAISMQATSIDGLKGQWSVKIDDGNKVVGIGLSSGGPKEANSEFIIVADKFRVATPEVDGGVPKIPFQIGTVNEQPAVVIPTAFIEDGSIDNAKIGTLDAGKITSGYIVSDRIKANSISVDKLEVGVVSLVNETWQGASPLTRWAVLEGTGEVTVVANSDGVVGSSFLRLGNNSGNDLVRLAGTQNIPFDPSRLYKLRVRVRRPQGTGSVFVGWLGIGADGTSYVNYQGANSYASHYYHAADNASPTASWIEYEGYTKGVGTTAGTTATGTLAAPGKMHPSVKYIRPYIVVNVVAGSGAAGITEVDSLIAEWVPVSIGPEYFDDGTFNKTLNVGDGKVKLDGTNKKIVISDGIRDRVILGNLGSSYGLDIKNEYGDSLLTATGDLEGARVKNLYVNDQLMVGGAVTIGGSTITYTDGSTLDSLKPASAGADVTLDNNFVSYKSWEFVSTADGWSGWNANLSNTLADVVRFTPTLADSRINRTDLSFAGATFDKLRIKLRRVSGSGWDGRCFYTTSTRSAWDVNFRKSIPQPTKLATTNSWVVIEFDMANLTAGGTDWYTSTITGLRFAFGTTLADVFDIDYISIGKRGDTADSTQGTLNIDSALTVKSQLEVTGTGVIKAGKTGPNPSDGAGYWLDNIGGVPKFTIGNSSKYLKWDGSDLTLRGTLNATDILATGFVAQNANLGNASVSSLKIGENQVTIPSTVTVNNKPVEGLVTSFPMDCRLDPSDASKGSFPVLITVTGVLNAPAMSPETMALFVLYVSRPSANLGTSEGQFSVIARSIAAGNHTISYQIVDKTPPAALVTYSVVSTFSHIYGLNSPASWSWNTVTVSALGVKR